jgi:pimeloyl-ACP methyl ester carboxylesterase
MAALGLSRTARRRRDCATLRAAVESHPMSTAPDPSDPAWLDTLAFAGASPQEIRERALAARPNLVLFDHPLAQVRMRVERRDGAGRALLVFLPDGPASIESYDRLVDSLAGEFDLAIVEIPGFGYSYPKAPQAMEFEALVDITAAAVASLAAAPAIWLGPCVQGLVAIGVARRHPALVRGLVVMQTGDWAAQARWGGAVLDPQGLLRRPHTGQVAFRLAREKMAVDWWAAFAAGPDFDVATLQHEARRLVRGHCCYALASLAQKWFGRAEPELVVDTPARIVWGLADRSHAGTERATLQRYLPHAAVTELPRVGHFVDLEAIDTMREEVRQLLR